ncbi:hypothetical protein LR48_Vigan01g120700 [Vigna angularis]|uniref:Uncharacterized protein n=1 Tax=Phaseolus angularis TaxID=3914 RepID=A0A0L9TMI4_PHAAN|nr:hypothetical protein LR48_Vigan01g120700 [Vigna angularis]
MGIILMANSLDVESVDMESSVTTMDEVISVNGVTNVEKANLEKKQRQKDEKIQHIGRLLDKANEIMNKQRVELEELKKVVVDKEEETSSVFEPNENGKEEDEDVKKNHGMNIRE